MSSGGSILTQGGQLSPLAHAEELAPFGCRPRDFLADIGAGAGVPGAGVPGAGVPGAGKAGKASEAELSVPQASRMPLTS